MFTRILRSLPQITMAAAMRVNFSAQHCTCPAANRTQRPSPRQVAAWASTPARGELPARQAWHFLHILLQGDLLMLTKAAAGLTRKPWMPCMPTADAAASTSSPSQTTVKALREWSVVNAAIRDGLQMVRRGLRGTKREKVKCL